MFNVKNFAALALGAVMLLSAPAKAATVLMFNGGTYTNLGSGTDFQSADIFSGAGGGAGSWQVKFTPSINPLDAIAAASITGLSFPKWKGLRISWIDAVTNTMIETLELTGVNSTDVLATSFSPAVTSQFLRISWLKGTQKNQTMTATVAAVPLPAGGLLLLGALGGFAALRRRKAAV